MSNRDGDLLRLPASISVVQHRKPADPLAAFYPSERSSIGRPSSLAVDGCRSGERISFEPCTEKVILLASGIKLASKGRKHYPAKASPRKATNNFFLGVRPKKEPKREYAEANQGYLEKQGLDINEVAFQDLIDNDFGAKPNINRKLTSLELPAWKEFESLVMLYHISRGRTFKEFIENSIKPHVLLEAGFEPHNIHTDLRHVVRGDDPKGNNEYYRLGTKMIGSPPNALQIEYGAVHWDADPPDRFYLSVQEETKPFSGGGRHKDIELELRTDKLQDRFVNFNREYHLTGNGTYYVLDRKLGKLVYAEDD